MTKSALKIDQIIGHDVDLRDDICGSGVTNGKFLELLCANCAEFENRRGQTKIKKVRIVSENKLTFFNSDQLRQLWQGQWLFVTGYQSLCSF
jgi:hypothetical protein